MPNIIFNGPDGRLEGRYQQGVQANAPVAVLLHPHPQHGGSMNNKLKVFAGRTHPELTQSICDSLGLPLGKSEVVKFSNDNLMVKILENVRAV